MNKDTLADWLVDTHNYPEVMDFDLGPAQVDMIARHMLTLKSAEYVPDS